MANGLRSGYLLRRQLRIVSFDGPILVDEEKFVRTIILDRQLERLMETLLTIPPFLKRQERTVKDAADTIDLDMG